MSSPMDEVLGDVVTLDLDERVADLLPSALLGDDDLDRALGGEHLDTPTPGGLGTTTRTAAGLPALRLTGVG